MLEKDYILRLLNQFFDELNKYINCKTKGNQHKEMISLFNTFVGDYDFFHTSSIDNIMKSFDSFSKDEKIYKIQMLAELYYQEALTEQDHKEKVTLWLKSLTLMEYIDIHSKTFSIDIKQKINYIRKNIEKTIII